jgi:hypothetical protein
MLFLRKNITNPLALTLSERTTLANPNYLFVFVNGSTLASSSVFLTKENQGETRYDLFELAEPSDLELRAGTYNYSVYEIEDVDDYDVTELTPIEIGLAYVQKTGATISYYTNYDLINYQYEQPGN